MAVVEFPAGEGGRVFVEVVGADAAEDGPAGLSRAGSGRRVVRAAERTWEQALEGMQAVAEGALRQVRRIDPPPEEVKVSFAVAVNGQVGVMLVAAGADAHLNVEVVWTASSGMVGRRE
jgi:hypothetical protein